MNPLPLPLLHPTAKLSAISVHPLNPLSPPPGGARGLNTQYRWVGQFRPGGELWCSTQGMDLVCDHQPPPISYTTDTRSGPIPTASSYLSAASKDAPGYSFPAG
jgi:hypothetical protein